MLGWFQLTGNYQIPAIQLTSVTFDVHGTLSTRQYKLGLAGAHKPTTINQSVENRVIFHFRLNEYQIETVILVEVKVHRN